MEFLIVQSCHRNRRNAEDRVETADSLLTLHFLNHTMSGGRNIGNVGQLVEHIASVTTVGFLIEVLKDVSCNKLDTLRCHECLLTVDIPYTLIINIRVCIHSFDVINSERKNVLIIDCIYDGVGVELISEGLLRCKELWVLCSSGIHCKDWSAGKAEQMILLEILYDSGMHVTKLTSVALIEDDDHMLLVNCMTGILLDKGSVSNPSKPLWFRGVS